MSLEGGERGLRSSKGRATKGRVSGRALMEEEPEEGEERGGRRERLHRRASAVFGERRSETLHSKYFAVGGLRKRDGERATNERTDASANSAPALSRPPRPASTPARARRAGSGVCWSENFQQRALARVDGVASNARRTLHTSAVLDVYCNTILQRLMYSICTMDVSKRVGTSESCV